MKFSAKSLIALAAIALLVVVVLGSSGTVHATHLLTTHADGKVYLTNTWSDLTTNPNGFTATNVGQKETYAGTGKTLYATFAEKNSAGVAQQTIETGADAVIISVIDSDQNLPSAKSATSSWTGAEGANYNLGVLGGVGSVPIIDSDNDGNYNDEITVNLSTNPLKGATASASWTVVVNNPTSGIIQVFSTGVTNVTQTISLDWKTSAVDTITALIKVTSTSDITGITLDATETGTNTGIFRATVTLIDAEVTGAVSATTTATAGNLIILNNGTVTAQYEDKTPAGTTAVQATGTKMTATAIAETTVPQVVISEPLNVSATQDRRPDYKGSVSDSASGFKSGVLYIDDDAEAKNTNTAAVTIDTTDDFAPDFGTAKAGDASVTWKFTPVADLPLSISGDVDHIVDFQLRANDLAGNVGWSDNDGDATDNVAGATEIGTATPGERVVQGRGAPHSVRIDRTLPSISDSLTGKYWDSATETVKSDKATSIEVLFDGPISSASIDATDFEVQIGTVKHVPSAAEVFSKKNSSVFLTLDISVPTDSKPTVRVKDQIADSAGNTTNAGSDVASDKLAPVLTLVLSGGATSDPDGLTKSDITATITSTESLTTVTVEVYDETSATSTETSIIPVFQGSNVWKAVIKGSALAATAQGGDKKSVYVSGSDTAGNSGTKGKKDDAAVGAVTYKLDKVKPTLTVTPATETRDPRPFVQLDFGEKVTVTTATFNKVDVKSALASTDSQKYVYKPTADLTVGTQAVKATVTDLAGNVGKDLVDPFEAKIKKAFKLTLLPGWNFVSLPAQPTDPSINSVVSIADVSTVVAYDAVAGVFTSAVREGTILSGALTTMDASTAYWVNTSSSDPISVDLVKPQGAQLPPSIPVVIGWNAIPVVDTAGDAAVGDKVAGVGVGKNLTIYFAGTSIERLYRFDTLSDKFVEVTVDTGSDPTIGLGYWGFFSKVGTVLP